MRRGDSHLKFFRLHTDRTVVVKCRSLKLPMTSNPSLARSNLRLKWYWFSIRVRKSVLIELADDRMDAGIENDTVCCATQRHADDRTQWRGRNGRSDAKAKKKTDKTEPSEFNVFCCASSITRRTCCRVTAVVSNKFRPNGQRDARSSGLRSTCTRSLCWLKRPPRCAWWRHLNSYNALFSRSSRAVVRPKENKTKRNREDLVYCRRFFLAVTLVVSRIVWFPEEQIERHSQLFNRSSSTTDTIANQNVRSEFLLFAY